MDRFMYPNPLNPLPLLPGERASFEPVDQAMFQQVYDKARRMEEECVVRGGAGGEDGVGGCW